MEKKEQIDIVLSQALDDLADSYQPDHERIIKNAKLMIQQEKIKKRKRTNRIAAAAVLVFAVLVVSLSPVFFDSGYAGHFRQFFNRESPKEDVIVIDNFIDGESKDNFIRKAVTVEDAIDLVPFTVALPAYLPEGYEMDECCIVYYIDEIHAVEIWYKNFSSEKKLRYKILPAENKNTRMDAIDSDKSERRTAKENDIQYTYTINNKSLNNIVYWENNQMFYSIVGRESGEDLFDIAISIKMEKE